MLSIVSIVSATFCVTTYSAAHRRHTRAQEVRSVVLAMDNGGKINILLAFEPRITKKWTVFSAPRSKGLPSGELVINQTNNVLNLDNVTAPQIEIGNWPNAYGTNDLYYAFFYPSFPVSQQTLNTSGVNEYRSQFRYVPLADVIQNRTGLKISESLVNYLQTVFGGHLIERLQHDYEYYQQLSDQ